MKNSQFVSLNMASTWIVINIQFKCSSLLKWPAGKAPNISRKILFAIFMLYALHKNCTNAWAYKIYLSLLSLISQSNKLNILESNIQKVNVFNIQHIYNINVHSKNIFEMILKFNRNSPIQQYIYCQHLKFYRKLQVIELRKIVYWNNLKLLQLKIYNLVQ